MLKGLVIKAHLDHNRGRQVTMPKVFHGAAGELARRECCEIKIAASGVFLWYGLWPFLVKRLRSKHRVLQGQLARKMGLGRQNAV